jgi:hypothetical protein
MAHVIANPNWAVAADTSDRGLLGFQVHPDRLYSKQTIHNGEKSNRKRPDRQAHRGRWPGLALAARRSGIG